MNFFYLKKTVTKKNFFSVLSVNYFFSKNSMKKENMFGNSLAKKFASTICMKSRFFRTILIFENHRDKNVEKKTLKRKH
jgi:hypothetical protein